jgi:hypothetical protein
MKVGLLLALVAMAIGFTMPTFAQQTNTPDPQLRQVVDALTQKITEAWNNNDPNTLTPLYTGARGSCDGHITVLRSGG